MNEEAQQLDLLAVFHYVVGGCTALFACFPFIHVTLGALMMSGKLDGPEPAARAVGLIFVIIGTFFILCGWALAAAILVAGRKLKQRKSRTYCLVIGALECMLMPFGTILGVFTLILLMKDSTRALFAGGAPAPAVAPPPAP